MQIQNLNIITEKVTDNRGNYWIARGATEHGSVLCYGPTRARRSVRLHRHQRAGHQTQAEAVK